MTRINIHQRACSACHKTSYSSTALWCFVGKIQCICDRCADDGACFAPDGTVVRCPSDLDIAIQRANEEYLERLREAARRRWARPGARQEMSRIRKQYWASRKGVSA